jgi:hypothetical protein
VDLDDSCLSPADQTCRRGLSHALTVTACPRAVLRIARRLLDHRPAGQHPVRRFGAGRVHAGEQTGNEAAAQGPEEELRISGPGSLSGTSYSRVGAGLSKWTFAARGGREFFIKAAQRVKMSSRSPVMASDSKSEQPHPSRLLKNKSIGPPWGSAWNTPTPPQVGRGAAFVCCGWFTRGRRRNRGCRTWRGHGSPCSRWSAR